MNILQGDVESLNISGPVNLVPRVSTTVRNRTLVIETEEWLTIRPLREDNPLTFTLVVKDLASLNVSGLGDVQIEPLSTPAFSLRMSGAGKVLINQLDTDRLNLSLSGFGGVDLSGRADQAEIEISGAGNINFLGFNPVRDAACCVPNDFNEFDA